MSAHPVLIGGYWRTARASGEFQATNPKTRETLPDTYPISTWEDCNDALDHAVQASQALRKLDGEQIAVFLERYAERMEARKDELVEAAHRETGLPAAPRLADVEFPRTTGQLRLAAAAVREGSWRMATIDTKNNIRSYLAPIGPVTVFGPNNFPFAFNSAAGGDFAAAIAAGNPVIAKAHTSHPTTTRLFLEAAHQAVQESGLPLATVQGLYRISHVDGQRLVSDPRSGAAGYTGSREAGLKLKAAADAAGKLIYLELSSINPVIILPGALAERGEQLADEFTSSCLMGAGQFCTNPGLVLLLAGRDSDAFVARVAARFEQAPVSTLLSEGVQKNLIHGIARLERAGATPVTGSVPGGGAGFCHANTLMKVDGETFLKQPYELQTEAFGNSSLVVIASDVAEASAILQHLEGNLTGSIYSATSGEDDELYEQLEPLVRERVGRLLNDKMPTGVAVSPAMNHGGPYPATGHPGFTAVGLPAAMNRFAVLQSFDNVRPARLPAVLQDKNPNGRMWRLIDGEWTRGDVKR